MIGANFPSTKSFFSQATKQLHRLSSVANTVKYEKEDEEEKKKRQQKKIQKKHAYLNSRLSKLNSFSAQNLPVIDEESPKFKESSNFNESPKFDSETVLDSKKSVSKTVEPVLNSQNLLNSTLVSIKCKEILTCSTLAAVSCPPVPRNTPKKLLETSKFNKSIKYNSNYNSKININLSKPKTALHTQTRGLKTHATTPKITEKVAIKSKLYTIGCGFSKDDNPQIRISAEHCIDDKIGSRNFGEDAAFITHTDTVDIMGVSDGVGGWRDQGVDPSIFSGTLMKNCLDLAKSSKFNVQSPVGLMEDAYNELLTVPDLIGSATVCTATYDRQTKLLYTANLGDSGWMVIRNGEIIAKSEAQCHFFNAPYQLAKVPKPRPGGITDTPSKAHFQTVQCEVGDIIILATDGLFDNVYDQHVTALLKEFNFDQPSSFFGGNSASSLPESEHSESGNESDSGDSVESIESNRSEVLSLIMKNTTEKMVEYTRMRAHQKDYISPFCAEYFKASNGKRISGGKVDDITILMSVVGPKKII
jgi:protein phosphatase PTC7